MLEGKQLILATRPYAAEHRATSWIHFLVTLGLLAASVILALSALPLPLRLVGSVSTGLMLVRMFMIYHDYLHQAVFRNSLSMKAFFTAFGLSILVPTSIWKRSHNYHHAHNSKLYTSSIGSFPIITVDNYFKLSSAQRLNYLFIRHPLTILFGYVFAFFWGMTVLSLFRNPDRHWDSAVSLVVHVGLGLAVFYGFGWGGLVLGFLLPMFISGAIGSYLFYAQHNFPGATYADKENWTFANAAMNSSSFMRGGAVMRWLTANIGYHHIHHANARIPFYRLPEAYAAIPEFQAAKVTSLWPRDIWACLRLKVWDPDRGRMLSMRELRDMSAAQPA